jgi:hypothetical protein
MAEYYTDPDHLKPTLQIAIALKHPGKMSVKSLFASATIWNYDLKICGV